MSNLKDFAEALINVTSKEVNELAEILKEEYGIEPGQVQNRRRPRIKNTDYLREQEILRRRGIKSEQKLYLRPKGNSQKFRRRR